MQFKYVAFKIEGRNEGQVYFVEVNGTFHNMGWVTKAQAKAIAKKANLPFKVS